MTVVDPACVPPDAPMNLAASDGELGDQQRQRPGEEEDEPRNEEGGAAVLRDDARWGPASRRDGWAVRP